MWMTHLWPMLGELADYYNGIIGSFRPELNETSADALDSILYDMVNK